MRPTPMKFTLVRTSLSRDELAPVDLLFAGGTVGTFVLMELVTNWRGKPEVLTNTRIQQVLC